MPFWLTPWSSIYQEKKELLHVFQCREFGKLLEMLLSIKILWKPTYNANKHHLLIEQVSSIKILNHDRGLLKKNSNARQVAVDAHYWKTDWLLQGKRWNSEGKTSERCEILPFSDIIRGKALPNSQTLPLHGSGYSLLTSSLTGLSKVTCGAVVMLGCVVTTLQWPPPATASAHQQRLSHSGCAILIM